MPDRRRSRKGLKTMRNPTSAPVTTRHMTRDAALGVLAQHGIDTRDGALRRYGDLVAERWGESERAAALSQKAALSHGLVANAVAVYGAYREDWVEDEDLRAAIAAILTDEDRAWLREGG